MQEIRILKAWDETAQLRRLILEAGEMKQAHTTPGQYLELSPGGDLKSYFALCNAPGTENFELLVKRGNEVADALAAKGDGDILQTKPPAGKGYPLAEAKGKDLLLFAVGSGIAPIRSVIQHVLANRADFGKVIIYYGQQKPEDFAFADELAAWQKGAEIIRVCSQAGDDWKGPKGHVQDAFKADPPILGEAVAFVCGMKDMVAGVTEALEGAGVSRDKVFQNF